MSWFGHPGGQKFRSEISNLKEWAAPPIQKWLAEDFAVTSGMNPPPSVPFKSTFFQLPLL